MFMFKPPCILPVGIARAAASPYGDGITALLTAAHRFSPNAVIGYSSSFDAGDEGDALALIVPFLNTLKGMEYNSSVALSFTTGPRTVSRLRSAFSPGAN